MNPISPEIRTGTIGELLVQIRLLQFGIQAAPPIKDSGNDLIAVHERVFRAIQVKTRMTDTFSVGDLPRFYHLLAVVNLIGEGNRIDLDATRIYLLTQDEVNLKKPYAFSQMDLFRATSSRIALLFKG